LDFHLRTVTRRLPDNAKYVSPSSLRWACVSEDALAADGFLAGDAGFVVSRLRFLAAALSV
jgi:hypothetical protein